MKLGPLTLFRWGKGYGYNFEWHGNGFGGAGFKTIMACIADLIRELEKRRPV